MRQCAVLLSQQFVACRVIILRAGLLQTFLCLRDPEDEGTRILQYVASQKSYISKTAASSADMALTMSICNKQRYTAVELIALSTMQASETRR